MCLICDKDFKSIHFGDYYECLHCGSKIVKKFPDNDDVQNVLEQHASIFIISDNKEINKKVYEERLAAINKYSKLGRKILDFGCGDGTFVTFLRSKNLKAYGYDKSKEIKEYLKKNKIALFEKVNDIPDNYFDVVTCFDVIEHVTKPNVIAKTMREKLKSGGVLVITTPNSKSLTSLILRTKWWVFGSTAHFIIFSPFSLKFFISRLGFRVLDVSTDTFTPWFTPADKLINRILNKAIYSVQFFLQSWLFAHYLGDNIQLIAMKK